MPQFDFTNSSESTSPIYMALFDPANGGPRQKYPQGPNGLAPGATSNPIQYQSPGGVLLVMYAQGVPPLQVLPAISAEHEHPVVVVPPQE